VRADVDAAGVERVAARIDVAAIVLDLVVRQVETD
jgi:hypothetical protein